MANLPKERLEAFIRFFTNFGLDCYGPPPFHFHPWLSEGDLLR
jgi:hypothetical protein